MEATFLFFENYSIAYPVSNVLRKSCFRAGA